MDYYEKAELTPYLEKLGFYLVGYGCTTCIGNSGPLPEPVSAAVNEADLAVVSVLSGNRNFEGRINPDVKMNYLASPPLVIAYALAGSMDVDLNNDPLGQDPDGNDVFLHDIWPSPAGGPAGHRPRRLRGDVQQGLRRRLRRHRAVAEPAHARPATPSSGTPQSTYVRRPPYFEGMPAEPAPVEDISGARTLAVLGDSVTTDHISPAGSIKADSPAGQVPARARRRAPRLQLLRLPPREPRGHDPRHVRQHPAAQPAGARHRGRRHQEPPDRRDDVDLRRLARLHRRRHPAGRAGRQGVRLRAPRATGRPRGRRCSASRRSSPRATSASTGRT